MCALLLSLGRRADAIEANNLLLFTWEPVTLKPQLAVSEVYNDNIFYQVVDPVADLTTVISPGLSLLVGKRSDDYLTFNYTFNQYLYVDRTDLDTHENLMEFSSYLEGQRLTLRGTDRVQFLSSPLGNEQKVLDPQAVDRPVFVTEQNIARTTYYDNYTLSYRVSDKAAAYLQAFHSTIDYEEGVRLLDQTTLAGTGGFAYQAFPKTILFGEGYYGVTSSEPNLPAADQPNSTFLGGSLGARGTFTPKIAGTVRLGYEARQFEDQADVGGAPVANLSLNYQFSPKTTFALNFVRRQDVSVYYNSQIYTTKVLSLQASQALGSKGKWRANLGGYFGIYNYEQTGGSSAQDYDVYGLNFALAYQIQLWLTASLGYDRSSVLQGSRGVSAYDVNRVTLRLAVGY